jgi:hypothetical protein
MFAWLSRWRGPGGETDPWALARFMREHGAYVAQKTIFDYCEVKAGRNRDRLFADPDFQAALRHCRWQVYLATLSDLVALAEAWLRPALLADRAEALRQGLLRLHAEVLAQEPAPQEAAATAEGLATALPGHLAGLQQAAPRPANALPLLAEAPLLDTLPIHAEQRVGEAPAIRGALRFHIVVTQARMERRFAREGLAAAIDSMTSRSAHRSTPYVDSAAGRD